jgi:hypothetical protein
MVPFLRERDSSKVKTESTPDSDFDRKFGCIKISDKHFFEETNKKRLKFFDSERANMKAARKIKLLSVLVSAVFLVQNASATVPEYLPQSSHYEGRSYFDYSSIGGASGHIDFAVYDTQTYPNELVGTGGRAADLLPWWDETNPDRFRYIYAYQILIDSTSSNTIDYFGILGMGENSIIKDPSTGKWPIGSMNDLVTTNAMPPDAQYIADSNEYGKMAVWEFTNGFLAAGDHSYFLVLGSNDDWTSGMYTFNKTLANDVPQPNPEPASITLFGIGGALTFIRTRKKFRKTQ